MDGDVRSVVTTPLQVRCFNMSQKPWELTVPSAYKIPINLVISVMCLFCWRK